MSTKKQAPKLVANFNAHKVSKVLHTLQTSLLIVTCLLSGLVLFFAYKWQQVLQSDLTYFLTPEATYTAQKRANPNTIRRDAFEIENFTTQFLHQAFAHNEFTFRDNLNAALKVMDQKSGLYLQSKFNQEDIFECYQSYHGLSTIELVQIKTNQHHYPYEVAAFYQTHIHFLGEQQEQPAKTSQHGVYFQVKTIPRSRENPYGLLITNFSFIAYEPVEENKP